MGVLNCGLRAIPQITDERTWIQNAANFRSKVMVGDLTGIQIGTVTMESC